MTVFTRSDWLQNTLLELYVQHFSVTLTDIEDREVLTVVGQKEGISVGGSPFSPSELSPNDDEERF